MFRPGSPAGNAFVAIDQQAFAGPLEHCCFSEDVFIVILQKGLKGGGDGCSSIGDGRARWSTFWALVLHNLYDMGAVGIGFVDSNFSGDPDTDNEGDGHAYRKASNINQGVAAISAKLAESEEKVIFKHVLSLKIQQNNSEKSTCFFTY